MDRARFDALALAVSGAATRRQAARTLAGGLLGLAGLAAGPAAKAGCGRKGQQCAINRNCCGGLVCRKDGEEQVGKCRYKKRCGRRGNFCTQNRDCCGGFRCMQRKCER
ncbi:MAG: hypothetical protein ACKOWF_03720 [Chloroflexota bacterium]